MLLQGRLAIAYWLYYWSLIDLCIYRIDSQKEQILRGNRTAEAANFLVSVIFLNSLSGSSICGRSKLSKIGNMKLKSLLSNGANAAIQSPNEFSAYYNRKIAQGKPKLVALNGVRNKLLSRVIAVVQRGTPYVRSQENYLQIAS